MKKWIRISGAGEFRGEGKWHEVRGDKMEKDFAECKKTGFLPVAWQTPFNDGAAPDINDVAIEGGVLTSEFHNLATTVGAGHVSIEYAKSQLRSLVEQLTVEGEVS